jgi:hypothetical protein
MNYLKSIDFFHKPSKKNGGFFFFPPYTPTFAGPERILPGTLKKMMVGGAFPKKYVETTPY